MSMQRSSLLFVVVGTACAQPAPELFLAPEPTLPTVHGMNAAEDVDETADCVAFELRATEADVELEPGTTTTMWTYNGMLPGPLLQARVGQHVHVRFTNNLPEPTTIHWHGMRVPNEMDGVVQGDMVAVQPGETFEYDFDATEAGTFWYHPHFRPDEQVERGLYGMFVVHEMERARPDVDAERAFFLDDVRVNADGTFDDRFGGGMDVMHGRFGNALLVNGMDAVVQTKLGRGQVERWRLGNSANARTMVVRFTGLDVRIVGSDGGLWPQWAIEELDHDLEIPVGARYDLEVRLADDATEGRMDNIVLALDENDDVVEVPVAQAQVVHDDSLDVDYEKRGHFDDPAFAEIDPDTEPTKSLVLSGQNGLFGLKFTINGKAYPNYEDWTVEAGDLQVIRIANEMMMEHPFHLHGQFFQVLRRNGNNTNEPGWRDTVLLGGGDEVVIATYFENPGMWMYHCHILEHEEAGMMAMVMVEGESDVMAHDE